jgi:hypothetical protein
MHMFKSVLGVDERLNLITCSGSYDKATQQHEQRILVVVKRIE